MRWQTWDAIGRALIWVGVGMTLGAVTLALSACQFSYDDSASSGLKVEGKSVPLLGSPCGDSEGR